MRWSASNAQCCIAALIGEQTARPNDIARQQRRQSRAASQGWQRRKRRGRMIETHPGVVFSPESIVRRQSFFSRGLSSEIVELSRLEPFEYRLRAPCHLLIASHRAERRDGETIVEGLPRSNRREFSGRLTFVPAGDEFFGWQQPRMLTRVSYFYIDPKGPLIDPELRPGDADLRPRLFFEDAALWGTAVKLTQEIERGADTDRHYVEALSVVLVAELARLDGRGFGSEEPARGGLAAWQRRAVDEEIEAHLAEPLSPIRLAQLVRLSPRHFARAFKQSYGQPPHQYQLSRRVDCAKELLGKGDMSVTEIAVALGFADTSAFSTTFRRFVGTAPRDYRRNVI
jgi:AraC family transcriptional regulator